MTNHSSYGSKSESTSDKPLLVNNSNLPTRSKATRRNRKRTESPQTESKNGFYRAFEERYYAPRDVIKTLRRQYLPFVQPLISYYPDGNIFDIGCGRGEWLELMKEIGFSPYGVDLDEGMLSDCKAFNLPAELGDAIPFLKKLENESQVVVSAFHVVEHISFEQLQTVVREALRVLRPGGLLIMETPNPENIGVATRNFYLDPTHQKPIPPLLLSFLPEYYGFKRLKILRLQESPVLHTRDDIELFNVLEGVSPDYAVVAQKDAPPQLLQLLDERFNRIYGIELIDLAKRYDIQLDRRIFALDQRLASAEAHGTGMVDALSRISALQDRLIEATAQVERSQFRAQEQEQRAVAAESRAQEQQKRIDELGSSAHQWHLQACALEIERNALRQSWSWRITAPVRWVGKLAISGFSAIHYGANRAVHAGISALRRLVAMMMSAVLRHPGLSYQINQRLMRYPALHQQLVDIARRAGLISGMSPYAASGPQPTMTTTSPDLSRLTLHAHQIYFDLKTAIEQRQKENG